MGMFVSHNPSSILLYIYYYSGNQDEGCQKVWIVLVGPCYYHYYYSLARYITSCYVIDQIMNGCDLASLPCWRRKPCVVVVVEPRLGFDLILILESRSHPAKKATGHRLDAYLLTYLLMKPTYCSAVQILGFKTLVMRQPKIEKKDAPQSTY